MSATTPPGDGGLEAARREKLRRLQAMGIDPWGQRFDNRSLIGDIRARAGEIKFQKPDGAQIDLPGESSEFETDQSQFGQWLAAQGQGELRGPRLWDANLGFDAALAGQGIALVTRLTAGAEIDDGRLVEILQSRVRLGGYFLMVAPDRGGDPVVARFEAWLEENLPGD